jgi:transposase-like protein
MSNRTRPTFSPEFRQEAAQLVAEKGYNSAFVSGKRKKASKRKMKF